MPLFVLKDFQVLSGGWTGDFILNVASSGQ